MIDSLVKRSLWLCLILLLVAIAGCNRKTPAPASADEFHAKPGARWEQLSIKEQRRRDSLSSCMRCGRSWYWGGDHATYFWDGRGCFPLCEGCWRDLGSADERLPYYRFLLDEWKKYDVNREADWPMIEAAVRAESSDSRAPMVRP